MTANGWIQISLYFAIVVALTRPLGGFLARAFEGERTMLSTLLIPIESLLYRVAGIDPRAEQRWTTYAVAMLVFNAVGFVVLYLIQRVQALLPLNPQGLAAVAPDLAFNTAVSFTTNTNWQAYSGEQTMTYLTQMLGLTVQNFFSAASGIALAIALIRGFARRSTKTIGNFWVDLVRATLYVLLPISLLAAFFFVWQGVPQNFHAYVHTTTVEGGQQVIAQGPVASQLAIKVLGTNGGGFFNANSAHPYENPTALSNLVQLILIFAIGAGLTNTFGRMIGDERQGWALFAAIAVLFVAGVAVAYGAEAAGNPVLTALGVDGMGGNMEGKEVRFGIAQSSLFATVTTAASCGAVIAMHDSFTPIGGMVPIVNILLGEVIVGGVGAGLYGMLLFVIVAVFVAGLMVGRTPEYVGKKIEGREVKMTMLAILCLPLAILGFAAAASVLPAGIAGVLNPGPHGFSEILYAYTSGAGNNGSAFAGLNANSVFYNFTLGITMLIGRYAMIVPMLAVAGSLAAKRKVPPSAGTFPTDGSLFVGLLVGVILIVGGLTYFSALALGPI
ncbi:MAG: potassium-transporting ATPase subunit KdpA, partial [Burkholderiales bacterium]